MTYEHRVRNHENHNDKQGLNIRERFRPFLSTTLTFKNEPKHLYYLYNRMLYKRLDEYP